jgi:hypothetical protein
MYTLGMVSYISRWDADTKMYSDYIVEWGMIDYQLSPGDGMWVYVEMTGRFMYEP